MVVLLLVVIAIVEVVVAVVCAVLPILLLLLLLISSSVAVVAVVLVVLLVVVLYSYPHQAFEVLSELALQRRLNKFSFHQFINVTDPLVSLGLSRSILLRNYAQIAGAWRHRPAKYKTNFTKIY